jgi:hypothetical protein
MTVLPSNEGTALPRIAFLPKRETETRQPYDAVTDTQP